MPQHLITVQGNWLISYFQETGPYSHSYHFSHSNSMYSVPILSKMIFFPPNHCRPFEARFFANEIFPLKTAPLIGFYPLLVTHFAIGISLFQRTVIVRSANRITLLKLLRYWIFPTQGTVYVRSIDGNSPTRRRQRRLAHGPHLD